MKLKRKYKVLLSLIIIIISWLMIGFGYSIKISHPINTILFLSGILFLFVGFILFLLAIKSK